MPAGSAADIVATQIDAERHRTAPLIVIDALEAALSERGLGKGPVEVSLVGTGHSNVTCRVERGGERWALRRPPRPPWPPSAHDVLREYRILRACADVDVRTPAPVMACEDPGVLGAPFYLMEFIDGHVMTTELPEALSAPEDRARIGDELVDALVEIHAVPWTSCGLADLGRPDGYLERQLRRFAGLWEANRTRAIAEVDEAGRRLAATLPPACDVTLVHGDFRLGNTVFAPDAPARLLAVLDWEMATIGDPLADLGYLTANWAEPDDASGALLDLGSVSALPGFRSRRDLVERYERRTGRSTRHHAWYEALAFWKSAIVLENLYRRGLEADQDDPFLGGLVTGVPELARRALRALDRND